ncbi:MAG TPA: hypothetical protein PK668_03105 [Myxococcota bacterium]|nr:hypothetical protein [Myxococcota bacterium]HRY91842.1 hypothetical protein [Myxococcota bacterium]HSA20571.1 hypothetical protein [Myxococcota bacterium]
MRAHPIPALPAWLLTAGALALLLAACAGPAAEGPRPAPGEHPGALRIAPASPTALLALPRADFNRLAVKLERPLFWARDDVNPGALDPDELVILGVGNPRERFVDPQGRFAPAFERDRAALVEARRLEAVQRELDAGRPTLVRTEFLDAPPEERAMLARVIQAARIVEEMYAEQRGTLRLRACLRPGDLASAALFRRNQSPWCVTPGGEHDPFCNACPDFPPQRSALYPAALQAKPGFCEELTRHPDAAQLDAPFSVVREVDGQLRALPYHEAFAPRARAVALELRAAADALQAREPALQAYLRAAAAGFESGDWRAADEAWAAMNGQNSRYYLRIGPDEVYEDPCGRKGGFHADLARIDPDAAYWQERLTPLRAELEGRVAALAGPTYQARDVRVHLPDFIEVVLNAGDSRSPLGATIGQSLPNWGPVADEGRGRTVVMSNLYTDPDSRAVARAQAMSLLAPEAVTRLTEEKRLTLLDIILHEATHNFGPSSDTRISGKSVRDLLGGPTATVLEELKAQTGSLLFVDLLRQKGLLSAEDAERVYLHALVWCFGHIARGLFEADGSPKHYSQVAAVQVAFLSREGALQWRPDQPAADGQAQGRFEVRFERLPAAAEKLMGLAARALATGDPAQARDLLEPYLRGEHLPLVRQADVAARYLRFPKASFVYSVTP